ncbi:alanine racemase [Jeotgalibacillus marinus]|uniref:Alanine racemase n=1 Tax=Jeotgalibacillus marinus TaxID=86667 RepID=A0ABV3Q6U1_9BACL
MDSHNQFHRDTWVDIDLDAIQYNIQQVAEQVGAEVSIMAVVKGNAYGHGYLQIAKTALRSGASHLAVALLDEALFLRRNGIEAPIVVLGASRAEDAGIAAQQQVQLTVFNVEWIEKASTYISGDDTLFLHLKCDTGMGRIGVKTADEVKKIEKVIYQHASLHLEGIFTHFATADQIDRTYGDEQLARFQQLLEQLEKRPHFVHASNSAGALTREDSLFSLIRFGISMYGLSPSDEIAGILPIKLKPALSFHTTLTHVKKIMPGEKVSYGSTYVADHQEWIGTLPLGYADGWIRKMQGFEVLIDGVKVPIVGRVCMDQCMIRLPQSFPLGTKVTLIGEQKNNKILIDEVARHLETIHYEVACAISSRVPRVYWQGKELISVLNPLK